MTTLGETWINIRPRIVDGEKFVEEVRALLAEAFGGVHTVDVAPSAESAPTPVAADSLTPAPEPPSNKGNPRKEDEESGSVARRRRTREQIAQDKESGRDDEFKQLLADHPDWSVDMIRHKMYGPQLAATADPEDENEVGAPDTPEPVRAPEPVMPPPAPWAVAAGPQQPAERPKAPWEP